jgi:hypothetical protein
MKGRPQVAVVVAGIAIACSRPGGRPADSAAPHADSIAPATVGKSVQPPVLKPIPTRSTGGRKVSIPASSRPHLTRLTPSSGSLATGEIIDVAIAGEGFAATGNTVFFGRVRLGDLPSPTGRTVHFAVPRSIPSRGEVPPMDIQPGSYGVYVVNSAGTSDTLTFVIKGDHP